MCKLVIGVWNLFLLPTFLVETDIHLPTLRRQVELVSVCAQARVMLKV